MSRIISYGWTWPALLAPTPIRKTCTRRDWKRSYAMQFHADLVCQAWTKSPRYHGKRLGMVRLTHTPFREPMAWMLDSDYQAEGFEFLNQHRDLLPPSMPIDVSPEGFDAWRNSDKAMWVIRFDLISISYPMAGAPLVTYCEEIRAEVLERVFNGTYI